MKFELVGQLLDIQSTDWTDDNGNKKVSKKLQCLFQSDGKYSVWELKVDTTKVSIDDLTNGEQYRFSIELKNSAKFGLSLHLNEVN